MAIGDAGHPDEQAMRQASLDQVKALVANDATAKDISGMESLRGFIGELTVRLGLVELTDQYASKSITAAEAHKREKGLRHWVKAKIGRLNLAAYGRVNATEFHQVARQMAADALRLMRGN
ncbi:hypothetical protein LRL17_31120 (plasmid) [Rhodococcus qingshengii]|uniref:hypothetical protein n=1 Tax=Rhodococcus qingshengii TaxID=334542 RepID=UPI001E447B1E|nr:hypothetical protein [Rhodococcus qingshengii]UGQ55403.1 hypothetical protein LRL17_31120 [Rhodococcus qingshengii]